jgi:hypothetical protein
MAMNLRATVTLALLLGVPALAFAQSPPPAPKSCEPGAMAQVDPSTRSQGTKDPGKNQPSTTGAASNGNLSDKLARSNGVLCPPNVDSGMSAPPPGGGKTPVIPPPGSPGGNPNVQPK